MDLFSHTEEELIGEDAVLTYYQILNVELHATQDAVKKAFRKLSLRYHPDKTQRGEDDYVFRAIRAAYDTLYDPQKRQAYDSTKVPFDDAIPSATVSESDFFEEYKPVFERNLRFDARLRPEIGKTKSASFTNGSSSGSGNKKQAHHANKKPGPPPELGDDDTPIEQVQAFYNYWIHFESWRDFSSQAADELQVENHLENAESRDERRYLQREIERHAKNLKRQEVVRIKTLVERAMESDPRLKRQRALERQKKQDQAMEKQRAEEEAKRLEQLQKEQQEKDEQVEREKQALEKVQRDKDKKQLRKARQQLRKMASSLVEDSVHGDVSDIVEELCSAMSLHDLNELNDTLEAKLTDDQLVAAAEEIRQKAEQVQAQKQQSELSLRAEEEEKKSQELERNQSESGATKVTNGDNEASSSAQQLPKQPWTRDELSALAKAVKKYPAGSVNRWDTVAYFVNHTCKGSNRTKEECVDKYNRVRTSSQLGGATTPASGVATTPAAASSPAGSAAGGASSTPATPGAPPSAPASSADGWTAEQDQQLQSGLANFPASMDKNERWDAIARGVPGKSKKECVQRFKTIREALLKKS
jgi:DnaJ homolog subfamily C member 2